MSGSRDPYTGVYMHPLHKTVVPVGRLNNPTETDWIEVKRIARYLMYTADYKLKLRNNNQKEKGLVGYADMNWAESKADRKSNSRYLFKYYSTIS